MLRVQHEQDIALFSGGILTSRQVQNLTGNCFILWWHFNFQVQNLTRNCFILWWHFNFMTSSKFNRILLYSLVAF